MRWTLLTCLPAIACASQLEILTLPNWQRVPVGEQSLLEGGAMVARVNGPSATYGNPAGLAGLAHASVSGSLTLAEYTRTNSRTAGGEASTDQASLIPNLVGFSNAFDEDKPADGGGWGFTLAEPIAWRSALQVETRIAGGHRRDNGASSLEVLVPGLGFGWVPHPEWKVGFALEGWLTEYRFDAGTSAIDSSTALTSAYTESGRQLSLRLALGTQWKRGPWSAGLVVRTPGLQVTDQGQISATTTSGDGTTTTSTEVHDEHTGFVLPLPWSATLGVAWDASFLDGLSIETDLDWHAGGPGITVLRSAKGNTTSITGAVATTTSYVLPERRLNQHWVANPRLGLCWRLPQTVLGRIVRLHAGAFIERSPVTQSDVFSRLNLLGATAGVSAERGPLMVTFGGVYITSSSLTDALHYVSSPGSGLAPSLQDPNTTFAVRSFILALGSSYRF